MDLTVREGVPDIFRAGGGGVGWLHGHFFQLHYPCLRVIRR